MFTAVVMLALFWLGYHGVKWLLRRYGASWRIEEQRDWAALVVLLLVISVFSFLSEPIENGFSRGIEHDADVYGQEAVHGIVGDPQKVAQQSFQVLARLRWMIRIRISLWSSGRSIILRRPAGRHLRRPTIRGLRGRHRSTSRSDLV